MKQLALRMDREKEIFAVGGGRAIVLFYETTARRHFVPKCAAAIADGSKKF
jgi:hypothetical protein